MKKFIYHIRTRLQRSIALVFVFVVLTIVGFILIIRDNNADTKHRAELVNLTYNISKYVQEIKFTLGESEAATRDYLLTVDPAWRKTVQRSHARIKELVAEVRAMAKDPTQRKRLDVLARLLQEKTALQRAIVDSDITDPGMAARMRFDGEERLNASAIHKTIGLFMDRQAVLLQQRSQASELANRRAQMTVIIGTAIVFLFITGTLLKLNKDIRRRKQAEHDIRNSEKKYRLLIEDAGVTIFTSDFAGMFTYVSGKCQTLTGYTSEELTGQSFAILVDPDWITVVADEYKNQVRKLWNETTIEFPIITKNGKQKWVEQHAVLMFDEHKSPVGYQCMVKDITDKRNQEQKLRESESRFRMTLEKLGDSVWEHDFRTKQTYFSETGYDFLGYSADEFESNLSMWWDSVHEEDRHLLEENDRKYKVGASDQHALEYRMICKDRSEKWVLDRGVVIEKDADGLPLRILGTHTDITDLKLAAQKLRESDQKMRAMLQSTREGFYIVSPDCVVQMINDAGVKNVKAAIGKICKPGDDFMEFIRPERKNIFTKIFENVLNGGTEENEAKMDTPQGEVWFHNSYFPLRNEKNEVIAVCMSSKDITERKLTERALNRISAEREEYQFRLQSILDNTPLIVFVKDLQGRYLLTNTVFRELMRLKDTDVIGKTDFDFDDHTKALNYKKGDDEVIRTLQSVEAEEEVNGPEGKRYLLKVKFPLFDKTGTIYGVGCIANDYTDKVEYRQKLIDAKKKAESAERLQEEFLANMSHEIRTPMNGIIGMTNIMAGTSLDTNQRELINVIRHSSDTLLYLINDILDFSKIKSGKFSLEKIAFNLNEVIDTTLAPFYPKANEKGIELSLSRVNGIPMALEGDPHRLKQILNNLLSNAIKFTGQGCIDLKVKMLRQDEKEVSIEFILKDTGIGIPADKLPVIFNSFEQASTTTSRKYGGTGLGLSITKRLIEMQGGQIEVKSVPAEGSVFCFTITYAKANEIPVASKTSDDQADEQLFGKNILVAEDNEINQKVIIATLAKKNINVTIANNGKEAVTILEQGKVFDLVILDMQMPEMDGFQTATYIRRKLLLSVPILAMTASALRNEKTKCLELGMNDYLAKPFSPDELFMRLKKLLHDSREEITYEDRTETAEANEWYNLSHLYEMEDNNYFCEILQLFLSDTPVAINEIKEAALYENWEEVYKKAHKLKSSLGILQMNNLLQLTTTIEGHAKEQKELDLIEPKLKQLGEMFELIRPMIEAELNSALVNV